MKRYIKSGFVSFTTGPRNNTTRKSKKSESRRELYDRVQDIMEGLGEYYSDKHICMNVSSRGPKGNRISAFRFDKYAPDRWRFTESEALDVADIAQILVNDLGIADRVNIIPRKEDSIDGYEVIIDVSLDPNILN